MQRLERTRANRLHDGEFIQWNGCMAVVHVEFNGGITPSRIQARPTTQASGFLGIGKHWKRWHELDTQVEDLRLDQEVDLVKA